MSQLNLTMSQYEVEINEYLNGMMDSFSKIDHQSALYDAMNYSLMAGGKRIRPMLALAFCRAYGGDAKKAMPLACAVELIHTYSLIHDDLPCMDDDDLRRGKPSCHVKYGEAVALLAGDALLTLAFELISDSDCTDYVKAKAAAILSKCAGAKGMIGGQVIDISNENNTFSKEMLEEMYLLKTGALLKAACQIGVIAATSDEKALELAGQYAYSLGMAFQIKDDILDVMGSEMVLGKPIGSDEENHKTTFVTLFGSKQADLIATDYTKQALGCLDAVWENDFLRNLTEYLLTRDH